MLQALTKKSKSKSRNQRGEAIRDPKWEGASSVETKSITPDFRNQRKFRCGKDSSVQVIGEGNKFSGSMRTRSTSSRRSCSAMVTFESIKPTQIWQASASPSPPPSTATSTRRMKPKNSVNSLALSMISQTSVENQWLSLSTGDEDDLSDSSDDDDEEIEGRRTDSDRGKRGSTSKSHRIRSSNSSSDSSSSFEISRSSMKSARHRRKRQSSRRHLRDNPDYSSSSSSTSSDSSSSSSSDDENEFDMCWKLKSGGSIRSTASVQSTPQLKRSPQHPIQQPVMLPSAGTPRYPSTHHYKRPQTLNLANSTCPRSISSRNSSKETQFVHTIVRAVEDFFPTLEWIEKYKVISVHRGDLLRIIPYPGTCTDKSSASTGWYLAQKWCPDHGSGTGPIGFVPKIVCSFICPDSTPRVTHISPRHNRSQDYTMKMSDTGVFMPNAPSDIIPANVTGQITVAPTMCDTASEPIPSRGLYPSPQLSLHTPSTTATKTSFTSIPAVYEIEDRDSGRGPSSGSEWSSGKGGSLSGATDINLDEKEQHPSVPQQPSASSHVSSSLKWSPTGTGFHRRSSLDQQSGSNFACPLPPPPMALLSHVCADALTIKKPSSTINAMSVSDTEAAGYLHSTTGTKNRLYVRSSKPIAAEGSIDMDNTTKKSEGSSRGSPISDSHPHSQEEEEGGTSGSPQSAVVVVPSNSDPAHWEPYKTMIQVGQNKLEKFTLV
ncbi:unnamed protein product [Hymenolepis diminuta]|uniref:SH3 domain-containing protein n=1 Tax=Hymenolepis diminuta TaxID=6216 RepID=A0A0R3SXE7_HYMDI|nr:unnamed protein product [Hymenolepis diminuta]VUZ48169.1 unnamed protein product [Hymenolepis diminuta]